jgi:hypothetical protein
VELYLLEGSQKMRGKGDIRRLDWWNDECGEGMRRQNENLPQQPLNVGSRLSAEARAAWRGDGQVAGEFSDEWAK